MSGSTFPTTGLVRQIDDYRIKEYLGQIEYHNDAIIRADTRIARLVKDNPNALLLKTIPGVGNFTALTVASMIGDIGRFNSPEALCAYAGVVPSVRGSANVVHHGHITKNGDRHALGSDRMRPLARPPRCRRFLHQDMLHRRV